MFFENRVNQGASGRVYPNPFTDRINNEEVSGQDYRAVYLENEYIQLMVLPKFGGRIHAARDKTNGYDFIYCQNVIKPALIGLFGSWLSGGMEFNWPLHHRPSTFMPVEYTLEEAEDGSVILWMSEHEPMNRMKGMVGVCVYPGKALFELKVHLYNRTPLPNPFLWWVNTAVHVNDDYQLIFPPDVESVTFHSRADMSEYPLARGKYAGLDWTGGVDISWPKNVNEATSYFANASEFNFFGGYDHGAEGGLIHVANRHISPGKKLFTWGTGDFGMGWQDALTDEDGPYVELMASAFSDNQPDFSWLQPYEAKTFSQFWYPIRQIGSVKNANRRVAVNLEPDFLGVSATEELPGTQVILNDGGQTLFNEIVSLKPGKPFVREFEMNNIDVHPGTELRLLDYQGNELISYKVQNKKNVPLPEIARPPKLPGQIDSLEELYLTGLHVEQYLHFNLDPADYWERALEIDPADSRSNNALGRLLLRRGDFTRAEMYFRQAIHTLTRYNFNPYDGEPFYNLGLTLAYQGRYDQAYDNFYKATWSYAWRAVGYYALAQIDVRRGDYTLAVEHLDRALETNTNNSKARVLKAIVLRKMGDTNAAHNLLLEILKIDTLNHWAYSELALLTEDAMELTRILRDDPQNYLDLAFDYSSAGLYVEASDLISPLLEGEGREPAPHLLRGVRVSSYPIVYYALGYFAAQMGDSAAALDWYRKGAAQPPDYCFPIGLEEQIVLEAVRKADPSDGRAAYYLGNLYYDKKQYEKAIESWGAATKLEPDFSIPWRNLGLALYNNKGDKEGARHCYEGAITVNPTDARLLLEMDQLLQRLGVSPVERLSALKSQVPLVDQRDDLSLTFAELYSQTSQPKKALEVLASHRFHAWEGGEGGAIGGYALAHVMLGMEAAESGDLQLALEHFSAPENPPDNLGIGRGMSLYEIETWFKAAETLTSLGESTAAEQKYRKVVEAERRIALWGIQSPLTYYAALSLRALGQESEARGKLLDMIEFAEAKLTSDEGGEFYTSKPSMSVFDDDSQMENKIQYHYLKGLAHLGLEDKDEAVSHFESVLQIQPYHWGAEQMLKLLG
jgi:tetratricopeptide (TPR) repeat protein